MLALSFLGEAGRSPKSELGVLPSWLPPTSPRCVIPQPNLLTGREACLVCPLRNQGGSLDGGFSPSSLFPSHGTPQVLDRMSSAFLFWFWPGGWKWAEENQRQLRGAREKTTTTLKSTSTWVLCINGHHSTPCALPQEPLGKITAKRIKGEAKRWSPREEQGRRPGNARPGGTSPLSAPNLEGPWAGGGQKMSPFSTSLFHPFPSVPSMA